MSKQAIDGASRLNAFSVEPEKLVIVTDPTHALFDERVLLPVEEKLVLNIMAFNVKQPVIVTKNGDDIEVVDGRQRVRAAVEANKRLAKEGKETLRIPVMLQKGDDADLFGMSVFLNEQRRDDSVALKAKKAQRLLSMGKSEDEVAVVFGVTSAAIRQWGKMADLAPAVRAAVDAGELSASAAAKLAPLKKSEQIEKLAEIRADQAKGKKTTAKKVAVSTKKARGQVAIERPSNKLLRRLSEYDGMNDEDRTLLRWVLGIIDTKAAGLETMIQEMEVAAIEAGKGEATKAATG